jgi:hypothetical protein
MSRSAFEGGPSRWNCSRHATSYSRPRRRGGTWRRNATRRSAPTDRTASRSSAALTSTTMPTRAGAPAATRRQPALPVATAVGFSVRRRGRVRVTLASGIRLRGQERYESHRSSCEDEEQSIWRWRGSAVIDGQSPAGAPARSASRQTPPAPARSTSASNSSAPRSYPARRETAPGYKSEAAGRRAAPG